MDKDYKPYLRCSECGKEMIYRNIGRNHWFYCEDCKVKTYAGSNLFSSWRQELMQDDCEDFWENNREFLKDYRIVDGIR